MTNIEELLGVNMNPTNVVPMTNNRDWKWYDQEFGKLKKRRVENTLEQGRLLIQAATELGHGEYEKAIKQHYDPSDARKYRDVAEHDILSNKGHGPHLPASMNTLWYLSKLSDDILLKYLEDGTINPKLTREEAVALRNPQAKTVKPETRIRVQEAIQVNPHANQREAAKELGVSLGVYQHELRDMRETGAITTREEQIKMAIQVLVEITEGMHYNDKLDIIIKLCKALHVSPGMASD